MSDTTTASVRQNPQRRTRKGNAAKATTGLAHQFLMRLAKAGFWLGDLQAVVDEPIIQEYLPRIHSFLRGFRQLTYLRRVIVPRPHPNREDFAEGAYRREHPGGGFYAAENKAQEQGDRLYLEAKRQWEEEHKKMFRPQDTDIADTLEMLSELAADISVQLATAQKEFKEWLANNAKIYCKIRTHPNWDDLDQGPWTDWYSDLYEWHDFCIERLGHGFFNSLQEEKLFTNLVMSRDWDNISTLTWHHPKEDGTEGEMSRYRKMGGVWHTKLKERVWELLIGPEHYKDQYLRQLLDEWPELFLEHTAEERQHLIDLVVPASKTEGKPGLAQYREFMLYAAEATNPEALRSLSAKLLCWHRRDFSD